METAEKHTISVLVENKFGVLARVAGLFSGRGSGGYRFRCRCGGSRSRNRRRSGGGRVLRHGKTARCQPNDHQHRESHKIRVSRQLIVYIMPYSRESLH